MLLRISAVGRLQAQAFFFLSAHFSWGVAADHMFVATTCPAPFSTLPGRAVVNKTHVEYLQHDFVILSSKLLDKIIKKWVRSKKKVNLVQHQ
jgi:hypothetical protein